MKIAEALARRKDLNTALSDLSNRIAANVTKQEGGEVAENADALIEQALPLLRERAALAEQLFAANLRATFTFQGASFTLSEALAEMERLKALHGLWKMGVEHASPVSSRRFSRDEIREDRVIDYASWQTQRDQTAKQMRELDLAIQQANWTLDLES